MNRRKLLTALGLAPVALVVGSAEAALPSIPDAAPLSVADKAALDAMSREELAKVVRVYAMARMNSFYGRCNSAYTLARIGDDVDAELVRSMFDHINVGHAADEAEAHRAAAAYAANLIGHDPAKLGPLRAVDFRFAVVQPWNTRPAWHFTFAIPGYPKTGLYRPTIVSGQFGISV